MRRPGGLRHVCADVGIGDEFDAFGAHLLDAALDVALLHFEIGDAVAQQAADAVGLFEDGDGVPGARELLRGGEACGSGTDDGDAFTRAHGGRLRVDPAFGKGAIDDGLLDMLDGHGRFVDAEHARGFARRGAEAAGEFREVIGGVQLARRFAPSAAID